MVAQQARHMSTIGADHARRERGALAIAAPIVARAPDVCPWLGRLLGTTLTDHLADASSASP